MTAFFRYFTSTQINSHFNSKYLLGVSFLKGIVVFPLLNHKRVGLHTSLQFNFLVVSKRKQFPFPSSSKPSSVQPGALVDANVDSSMRVLPGPSDVAADPAVKVLVADPAVTVNPSVLENPRPSVV